MCLEGEGLIVLLWFPTGLINGGTLCDTQKGSGVRLVVFKSIKLSLESVVLKAEGQQINPLPLSVSRSPPSKFPHTSKSQPLGDQKLRFSISVPSSDKQEGHPT